MDALLHVLLRVLRFLGLYENSKTHYVDVVGSGNVEINLGDYRNVLSVEFDDDPECQIVPPPCGGGVSDTVEWKVHSKIRCHKKQYHLSISWSVQCPRRIVWVVSWR